MSNVAQLNGGDSRRSESCDDEDEVENSDDIHFEPLITLPKIDVKSLEEDEEVVWKTRAKLYRFETKIDGEFVTSPQWKERGIGEVKFLQHKSRGCVRLLMRREQTLKICANHYILPNMNLIPHNTSNRTWIWTTLADFADEEPKREMLALRFKDVENSKQFETEFEKAKRNMEDYQCKFASSTKDKTVDLAGDARDTIDKTVDLASDVPKSDARGAVDKNVGEKVDAIPKGVAQEVVDKTIDLAGDTRDAVGKNADKEDDEWSEGIKKLNLKATD